MMFRSKPICLQHDLSVCSKHYSKITNVVLELSTQSTKGFFSFILNEVSFFPVLLTIHKQVQWHERYQNKTKVLPVA